MGIEALVRNQTSVNHSMYSDRVGRLDKVRLRSGDDSSGRDSSSGDIREGKSLECSMFSLLAKFKPRGKEPVILESRNESTLLSWRKGQRNARNNGVAGTYRHVLRRESRYFVHEILKDESSSSTS